MQTKLLKYLFRGNNVELTANCTFDFIARVLIRTNSYKQTVNRWGARTARKWPAVFRPLGICNYANSASISISTRKAKATSSASRREPVVIFDREAAKASARPRVCLATKAKGFPFLTWKGRKCQDTWHNLSLIRFNAADIAIIVMHKVLFMVRDSLFTFLKHRWWFRWRVLFTHRYLTDGDCVVYKNWLP